MAIEFYVEQADRSPKSGVANEEIYAGELVSDTGSGVDVLTFATATGDGSTGLARYDAQAFAREYEDEVREDKYVPGEEQRNRVQYQELEDSAVFRIRTVEETTDGVTTAPDIGHRDVVGIVDEADADAPSSPGRVVQEGYTNDENDDTTTTTFERGNDNFKAIGRAYRPDKMHAAVDDPDFDEPVRVVVFSEVKEA